MEPTLSIQESIRRRPGMYVGDIHDGLGLIHMLWEVVANALDEHLAGRCTQIAVTIRADGSVSVDDNGRGFPIDEVEGLPFVELALTRVHTGPSLDGHAPHEHVALHGVGLCPVAALSEWLVVDTFRDGRHHQQRFERGLAATRLMDVGPSERHGTRLTFAPDPSIFSSTWFDPGIIATRLRELSCLLPGLSLEFSDQRAHRFFESISLTGLLERSRGHTLPLLRIDDTVETIRVEVAAQWHAHHGSKIDSYANIARTTDGGTHVNGLLTGLRSGLRRAMPAMCRSTSARKLSKVVSEGLHAIVCVRLVDPTFDSPTRSRLATKEVASIVASTVEGPFAEFLQTQPELRERFEAALAAS